MDNTNHVFSMDYLHGQADQEVGRKGMGKAINRLTVGGALVLAMPMLADVAIPYVCFLLVILDHLKF